MAVELIDNQQFIFDQIENCCDDDKLYFQKIAELDEILIQFKQFPCSDSIVCDPDFLSEELVVDGDFETDPTLSGWNLGAHFTWDSVNKWIKHGGGDPGSSATFPLSLANGEEYYLTFDITFIIPDAGQSMTPKVGGTSGTAITLDGHYGMYITTGVVNEIEFAANGFADCAITNVSLKRKSPCWDFDTADIVASESGACHISNVYSVLTALNSNSTNNTLVIGIFYKIVLTVAGMTQGSVIVFAGSVNSIPLTANGEQTVYLTSNGNDLTIAMSADFDGCITEVNAYPLRTDFQIVIKDLDDNLIADINPVANSGIFETDGNQYVTFKIDAESTALLDLNGDPLPYGCYKICFYDPCKSSIEAFAGNNLFGGYLTWVPSNPDIISAELSFAGWKMHSTGNGDGTSIITTNDLSTPPLNSWTHSQMQVMLQVDFITGAIADATNRIYINLPDNNKELMFTNVVANTAYKYHRTFPVDNTNGATYQDMIRLIFEADGTTIGNDNFIRSLIVTVIPMTNASDWFNDNDVELCSNIFQFSLSFDCTKLLEGDGEEDYSLGFYFGGIFKLKNRLKVFIVNPSYPQEVDDDLFSDGVRSITYAQSEKFWTVKVTGDDGGVDEATHDNINAMIISDIFTMDATEYFVKKGEYKPGWNRDGSGLAESEFQAKKKNKTIFNRNV